MTEDDPLFYWRLSEHLSVEDAAILVAGGDPSEVDEMYFEGLDAPQRMEVKRTDGHPHFVATFTALKTAVRLGRLNAALAYRVHDGSRKSSYEPCWVLSKNFLSDPSTFKTDLVRDDQESVAVEREPDWSSTMLDVQDLRVWLQQRGVKTGFFFPASKANEDDFMDPSHEHFAPELAMAALAWRGLSRTQKFPNGPKAAIEKWINENFTEWRGEIEMSKDARERMAKVANWRRSGGANPTGG